MAVTVFSRRFSREKCPTLTVASFFLFFSSDYNLTLIGPFFLQSKLLQDARSAAGYFPPRTLLQLHKFEAQE